jgi:glycosyltransferase involved in cell wall biosynthesis
LVDTLQIGGAERLAVNLANCLPRDQFQPFFCVTRGDGPLRDSLNATIPFVNLARRHRFAIDPVRRLIAYIREHDIRILHAHSSSLFLAQVAARLARQPAVIWHVHYGRFAAEDCPAWTWRIVAKRATVIAVSRELAEWSKRRLAIPSDRVFYLPNFVLPVTPPVADTPLPGKKGARVICVGNSRPEKDHITLMQAFALVLRQPPDAQLLIAGAPSDREYFAQILDCVNQLNLSQHVSFLGQRKDLSVLLPQNDVAVLSSATEGLPMALLEYGLAKVATVATAVGQCPDVLDHGRAGILVPPKSPESLAQALLTLLASPAKRSQLAQAFHERVVRQYSAQPVMAELCEIYRSALTRQLHPATCGHPQPC